MSFNFLKQYIIVPGKFFLLILFLSYSSIIKSQSITRSVISNGGGFGSNSSYTIYYNIGELSFSTWSLTNLYITEGFEQGAFYSDYIPVFNILISPNPVSDLLAVSFSVDSTTLLFGEIYNLTGIMLNDINFGQVERGTVQNIDFSRYCKGVYLLKIITIKGNVLKIFKVIKM
jgi:hypothetical protein